MADIHYDRTRAKAIADFIGESLPAELGTMEDRRKAVLAVSLDLTPPDVTAMDPGKIAAAMKAAPAPSEGSFNRVRSGAVDLIDRAYSRLASEFVKGSYPKVAAKFNDAAHVFVENYKTDVIPVIHSTDFTPENLSAKDFVVYAAARDGHATMEDALKLATKHIVPQASDRAVWHRRVALTVDFDSYDDAYALGNMDTNTTQSLFGLFGIAVRQGYRLSMPSTLDEYHARMDVLARSHDDEPFVKPAHNPLRGVFA